MNGEGPDRQRESIALFAERNGIEIAGWYVESHTGTDLEGRPEFRDMRTAMVSNGVRCVIVEKLDRLARTIMIQETIIADFKKHEITLQSATPGEDDLCGNDPTRVLIRQILACFFEYERSMIVAKLADSRRRVKAKEGRCEGKKPYGSQVGEPEILGMILARGDKGETSDRIAADLNDRHIPTRSGGTWRGSGIRKILARLRKA
jgi:DNA invertase Pin-like site-specific DNA recombinase